MHIMYSTYVCLLLAVYSTNSAKISPQIIGGSAASISSYPYQVAILKNEYDSSAGSYSWQLQCGGAILSKSYILTAAHCTVDYKATPSYLSVRAGSANWTSGGRWIYVNSIKQHPYYSTSTDDYDIATIKLDVPLNYTTSIKAIGLALSFPSVGTMATIAGWGRTSDSSYDIPKQLRVAKLPLMSSAMCQSYFSVTGNMFCAGYSSGSPATCNGDSGGPLVYGGKVLGLVSFGMDICTYLPTVFTNVPALTNWVKTNAVVDL